MTLLPQDLELLQSKGISRETLDNQLRRFVAGFPYLRVMAPATPGRGILALSAQERDRYICEWERFLSHGGTVVKMVPASGAASRMFKDLFAYVSDQKETPFISQFIEGLPRFAFYEDLDRACIRLYGHDIPSLLSAGRKRDIVKALIDKEGLDYGQLPKALLLFHKEAGGARTPIEEHLAEGAGYAAGSDGKVHVHFTVSPSHIQMMQARINEVLPEMEKRYGVKYQVDMSIQKPSTDTVAVNMDNTPYRENDHLFFRPAGHGALLANLAALDEEVVFLKNIDNVVPESQRATTIEYKKILGGVLVDAHRKIAHYADMLRQGLPSRPLLDEMLDFMHDTLFITDEGAESMDDLELADYLLCKFDRPLRVCGMVRNEGEPGGGPFLAYNSDGTISPQILESSQFDPEASSTSTLLASSTHFNPVDLVCYIRDLDGRSYDLSDYVDEETGLISRKSRKGVEIKALELPGLWNGSMSDWNTIFVEVSPDTFNPVKTVNDLLRPAHQD